VGRGARRVLGCAGVVGWRAQPALGGGSLELRLAVQRAFRWRAGRKDKILQAVPGLSVSSGLISSLMARRVEEKRATGIANGPHATLTRQPSTRPKNKAKAISANSPGLDLISEAWIGLASDSQAATALTSIHHILRLSEDGIYKSRSSSCGGAGVNGSLPAKTPDLEGTRPLTQIYVTSLFKRTSTSRRCDGTSPAPRGT
jgi:hypothetical protein